MRNENIEKALYYLSKSIELAPDYPEARCARAKILSDLGRHDEAINDLDEAIRAIPRHVHARSLKAEILKETNRPQEAIDCLTEGINIEPTSDELYFQRGLCHMEKRDIDRALVDFGAVVKLNPLRKDGHYFLGSVLLADGEPHQALQSIEKALELDPQFTFALFQWFMVLSALGRDEDARTALARLEEIDPEFLKNVGLGGTYDGNS